MRPQHRISKSIDFSAGVPSAGTKQLKGITTANSFKNPTAVINQDSFLIQHDFDAG